MKNFFIYILLSFFLNFNSYAEWTEMSKNVSGDTLYFDRQTLKIVGDKRYFLFILNIDKN